jgi:hypothetical protein
MEIRLNNPIAQTQVLKPGAIANYFPSSVIKGMLAAIGIPGAIPITEVIIR